MKKARTKILTGMALLLGVALMATVVWAAATKTPVGGSVHWTVVDPGKNWIDEEGVLHYRGLILSLHDYEGDLVGEGTVVLNINVDLATGNGDNSAYITETLTWETPWGETLTGTFEGRQSSTYTAWVEEGHAVLHGSGDFAGMKLMYTLWTTWGSGRTDWEGIMLDPHGE